MSTLESPPTVDAERLAGLFHHRWAVPVLAVLSSGAAGGRFAAMVRQLGVSRPSLKRTLVALEQGGLARPNPGYGHPMRPEYLLTDRGRGLGPWCERLLAEAHRLDVLDTALRKWSAAVIAAIRSGAARFSEIRAALPSITPRTLTLALGDTIEAGLVERVVFDDRPPSVVYRLARRAVALADLLATLPAAAPRAPAQRSRIRRGRRARRHPRR